MGIPGDIVVVMKDGKALWRDGVPLLAILDENGEIPAGCCCPDEGEDCSCCETPVPTTITGTIDASDCADIVVSSDFEMTLTGDCSWQGQLGPFDCLNGFLTFSLRCQFGNWSTDVAGFSSGDFGMPVSTNCSPFELVFDYFLSSGPDCGCVAPRVIRVRYTA